MKLVADIDEVYAMRGSKLIHLDLRKSKPGKEELAAVMLGPTGNLKAPTLRQGRKLLVGFNEETYRRLLC